MGFLFSHVKSRKTTGSLVTTREESWGSEVIDANNNRKRRLGGGSGESTPRKNKRYEEYIDREVPKTLKEMESHRQEDEDDHFGKVVAAELLKIEDPRTKQIRKARIYMVATGIEF
ncbi:hypothetical protein RN001_005649 [Aquatica leii]|uniref:Uncharacterized protein n=1 Tax=Aquatica leii TaxID=1421715 RepID=A0AAN7SS38_9COLE|nr:hypothetical protein RN001_005649 [Aquatica leii]